MCFMISQIMKLRPKEKSERGSSPLAATQHLYAVAYTPWSRQGELCVTAFSESASASRFNNVPCCSINFSESFKGRQGKPTH